MPPEEGLLCAMKTKTDGYFYIPTKGPFIGGRTGPAKTLKIELLFDNPGLEGDQQGGTPPYEELDVYPDGYVGIDDVSWINDHFGASEGDAEWHYMADVIADKYIGIDDTTTASDNYGNEGTYITDLTGVTVEFDTGDILEPNAQGQVPIPEGATYFYVKKNGNPIGALITFWETELVQYTLTLDYNAPTKSETTGNVVIGDTVTFSGTLTDNQGNPVSGAYIDIIDESTGNPINDPNTIQTGTDGSYSYDYTMPTTAGTYNYHAECSDPQASSDTLTITVEERSPSLTLDIDSGYAGQETNWHGYLIDYEPEPDYPLEGRTVELYQCTDDTCSSYTTTDPIATATTQSDGSYIGTFTLPSEPGKTYYYQARFPGDTPASVAMGGIASNPVAVTIISPDQPAEVKSGYPPTEEKTKIEVGAMEEEEKLPEKIQVQIPEFVLRNWYIILILSAPFIIYGTYKLAKKMRK